MAVRGRIEQLDDVCTRLQETNRNLVGWPSVTIVFLSQSSARELIGLTDNSMAVPVTMCNSEKRFLLFAGSTFGLRRKR